MTSDLIQSDLRQHDRETLSALFDGELRGDAARFALKRLEHDPEWREAVERWQLAGDILRGHPPALLPSGFAARVSAAVATDASSKRQANTRARGRWIGGTALAASLAAAVMFLVQRAPEGPESGHAAPPRVVAAPSAASPALPAQSAPVSPTPAKAVAVAAPAPPTAGPTPQRPAASRRMTPSPVATATSVAAAGVSPRAGDPFTPPEPPTSRPWPRAVLPQYGSRSALTAGFGTSPSLHPFEPRMPPDSGEQPGGGNPPR
jgi:negative regulator of sigma E activity